MTAALSAPPNAVAGDARPRLNPMYLYRWEDSQQAHVLLYPEGVVKLNPSAGQILSLCDGQRSADALVDAMLAMYLSAGDPAEIEAGVRQFLETAHAKGWLLV